MIAPDFEAAFASYQQGVNNSFPESKKREAKRKAKREPSPYNPYKRKGKAKAKGKENNPCANSTGLFARTRTRKDPWLKRSISAAVEEALVAFGGTRRKDLGKDCDESLWAEFAWKVGLGIFQEIYQATLREFKDKDVDDADKPKHFQKNLNPFWERYVSEQLERKQFGGDR